MSFLSRRWCIPTIFLLSLIFLLTSIAILPQAEAPADGEIVYGQIDNYGHYYESSIDGAKIPCSVYFPTQSSIAQPAPLWVNLHAFGGHGTIDSVPTEAQNWFVLSPWGRNYKSIYADGKEVGTAEPNIFDQFESDDLWTVDNGNWDLDDGWYEQDNTGAAWHRATLDDTEDGANYTVTVDMREVSRDQAISGMGIIFRQQDDGDHYLLDLRNVGGLIYLGLGYFDGANYTGLTYDPLTYKVGDQTIQYEETDEFWPDGESDGKNIKVNVFEDVIEVQIDNQLYNLDPSMTYHNDQSWGARWNDATFADGGVGLASYGGEHEFDNFRVQNEFLYGETDIIDCINQFIEEVDSLGSSTYRVDRSRIYLSGYSMGGVGTWNVGLHYPDLFGAIHPANGTTDLFEGYDWINTYYPDDPPPFGQFEEMCDEQDQHIGETVEAFLDGAPGSDDLIDSSLHEYSARWVLENSLNTPMRVHHPQYDALIPNVVLPLDPSDNYMHVQWHGYYTIWWFFIFPVRTYGWLTKYNNLTPQYAHADYVWQQWDSIDGLTQCLKETSKYKANGDPPDNPSEIWDPFNYSTTIPYGAHSLGPDITTIPTFFTRAFNSYGDEHVDPPSVAYKTYDSEHNSAWWLKMEIEYPDQDIPGLARVVNGRLIDELDPQETPFNGAEVHVKNVAVTTLDLGRMGLDTSPGETLYFTVDTNTAPESEEFDAESGWTTTDLKLVGNWYPDATYSVELDGDPITPDIDGTVMTIEGIETDEAAEIEITIPASLTDLLAEDFENGDSNWIKNIHLLGSGSATMQLDSVELAHGDSYSALIRDAGTSQYPFVSCWSSNFISVSDSQTYVASAFAKTRALTSVTKTIVDGKYSVDDGDMAKARLGIYWYDQSFDPLYSPNWPNELLPPDLSSEGLFGSNDWTPLEISDIQPPDGAEYVKVLLYVENIDGSGSNGSVWFDDVRFSRTDGGS